MPSYPPPEIWRAILRFATAPETPRHVDYTPFEQLQEFQETAYAVQQEFSRLKTCVSLVSVSRRFRAMAAEFLYEDVRISEARGLESLLLGLMRSAAEGGPDHYGLFVKRLELPRRRTHIFLQPDTQPIAIPAPSNVPGLAELLALCPNLEVFVRPCLRLDAASVAFWSTLVANPCTSTLLRLRRLEWHESDIDSRLYGTAHIARLREMVICAPNLRYLALSSDRTNALTDLALPASLSTVRFNCSYYHAQPRRTSLFCRRPSYTPHLQHLVLHTTLPPTQLDLLTTTAALSLRVLEFAFAPQMVLSANTMRRILGRFPGLEELVYTLGAPEIAVLPPATYASVRRVRLKLDPDEWIPSRPVLRGQVDALAGPAFPCLEQVVLHDEKRWAVKREMGREMVRRFLGRGCRVVYDDGESVMLPSA
ncbi:hypothetical protein FB45DRAFT_1004368 [Roridomyces roridus]|uniref:F-box domain-containing protein n=1 Tax=Roridomyces roridus TaxID=1738132 RepID=A0AAD7FK77_9AGAR|nr:hypothetical protein FB45DRAFT_1004368 [Roridomyces roridus]